MYHVPTATARRSRLRYITDHVALRFLLSLSSLMSYLKSNYSPKPLFSLLETRGIGYELMLLIVSGPN